MRLRKLEPKDAARIYQWMKDPTVSCFFRFDPQVVTMDTVRSFISAAQEVTPNLHLGCVDESDAYLGTVSLKNINQIDKTAEYAIVIYPFAQGMGAAQFATRAILQTAFFTLELEKIYLNVLEENTRAIRFYEKEGFVLEGLAREHIVIRGTRKSLRWYGVLRQEWINSHGSNANA